MPHPHRRVKPAQFCVVLVTCPTASAARRLAKHLVGNHLAACVNVVPGIQSIYRWQGKVTSSQEALLLIKTRIRLFKLLNQAVLRKHPYKVPEILAVKICAGDNSYLSWLGQSCLA